MVLFQFAVAINPSMEASLDNRYGKVVLDKVVVADYTATMGDSFWGIKRLRLANEGSAKNNIEKLIRSLSIKQVEAGKLSL